MLKTACFQVEDFGVAPASNPESSQQDSSGVNKMVDYSCQYKTLKPTPGLGESHA